MITDQILMDRAIAAAAGMSCALYFLASVVAWVRLFRPRRRSRDGMASRIIVDRAIAWSALFVVFLRIVLVRLGVLDWSNDMLDLALLLALLAIWACGLASIRAITTPIHGSAIWLGFAIVSAAVGVAILLF